jgi:riboflavin kinase / FMN adenylyltransferase
LKVHKPEKLNKKLFHDPVVTVGIFDGMHIGHSHIMDALKQKAKKIKGETVVVTLWPHPRTVLFPGSDIKLLNTIEEKQALLENAGIDHFVVIPFDVNLSKLSARDFINEILVKKIGLKCLMVGFDNHFGHNKEGNFDVISKVASELSFEVVHLDAYFEGPERVSSTAIRVFLELGEVDNAARLLGYSYKLTGTVVKGKMLGQSIGFPTANIEPASFKMLPRVGVYAVAVDVDKGHYMGMLNIGFRPTVEKLTLHKTIEVHIIDFESDLYGKKITVNFAKRLRDEMKFRSIEELKSQLETDKRDAVEILQRFRS